MKHAAADKAWNTVTSHTTYDILLARIPQLMTQCRKEHCVLSKSGFKKWGSMHEFETKPFQNAKTAKNGALKRTVPNLEDIKKICGVKPDAAKDCKESKEKKQQEKDALSAEKKDLGIMRLITSHDGILGWKKTLDLNERLKKDALTNHKLKPNEFYASPRLPKQGVAYPSALTDELDGEIKAKKVQLDTESKKTTGDLYQQWQMGKSSSLLQQNKQSAVPIRATTTEQSVKDAVENSAKKDDYRDTWNENWVRGALKGFTGNEDNLDHRDEDRLNEVLYPGKPSLDGEAEASILAFGGQCCPHPPSLATLAQPTDIYL